MTTNTFALDLQRPFNLRMTVESHGWCQLAPWHWDGESLERTVRIGTNAEWARVHHQHLLETDQIHGRLSGCSGRRPVP